MHSKLKIPFSGRNPEFSRRVTAVKPHLLVLNKVDLIPKHVRPKIEERLQSQGSRVLFTTNRSQGTKDSMSKILPTVKELIEGSERYNRTFSIDYSIMVIGIPNVGKSTIINALRRFHSHRDGGARVGKLAGVTRGVSRLKIQENPPIYLLDTPGIMSPQIATVETGLRLALCATLSDHRTDPVVVADYLLFLLNKQGNTRYVSYLNLEEPCDDIQKVLKSVAANKNFYQTIGMTTGRYEKLPHLEQAAHYVVRSFREGSLGKVFLDSDFLERNMDEASSSQRT